ncbi:MAG: hypothetical protein LBL91_05625 [Lachnospiraceae bacterium]|jgi:rubrerythrin|nr:hypothetical protein [Lachnospiraceae bacterium]
MNEFLQLLELNQAKEAEAREYYYQLLEVINRTPSLERFKPEINEIINDEIDHTIKLMKITETVSVNKPSEYESVLKLRKNTTY